MQDRSLTVYANGRPLSRGPPAFLVLVRDRRAVPDRGRYAVVRRRISRHSWNCHTAQQPHPARGDYVHAAKTGQRESAVRRRASGGVDGPVDCVQNSDPSPANRHSLRQLYAARVAASILHECGGAAVPVTGGRRQGRLPFA